MTSKNAIERHVYKLEEQLLFP